MKGARKAEILVGTDGSLSAATAVHYALDLGAATGSPVRIVHVVPSHHPVPPFTQEAVMHAGQELLLDVVRRAQLAAPQVEIRTSLLVGPRHAELVTAAESASMVVLGRSGRLGRLATGSTAAAIVENTACPVRVIPSDWRTRSARSEVVVGVKDIARARDLVRRGFEIAAELDEPLVLLHAWGLPSGYEDVLELEAAEAWNLQLARRIENEAREIRTTHPDVPFQVRIEHARTSVALQAASHRAAFLLVGRPGRHNPIAARTGLVHVIANVSECPVEIGPEPHLPPPPLNLAVEAHGALLR